MRPFLNSPTRGAMVRAVLGSLAPVVACAAAARAQDAGAAAPGRCDTACADGVRFGLHARERVEVLDRQALAPGAPASHAVAYHRVLGSADARLSPLRAFVQVGTYQRSGNAGPAAPIAVDHADVQQAFLDAQVGAASDGVRVRVGRAEMPFELVASRDAPNVRRAWDGVRVTGTRRGWAGDAFALQVVRPRFGAFDDGSHDTDRLAGLHLTMAPRALGPFAASAFFYDARQARVAVLAGAAASRTRTYGAVLGGRLGGGDASFGGARQTGRFGARRVDAFYGEAELGRRFARAWARPRVAARATVFSGGPADAARVRAFNPLFPNYAYSTEAALQSPSNLVRAALLATAAPGRRLTLAYRGEGLWRYSARDAFYVPAGYAFVPPDASASDASGDRWIGLQQQASARWWAARGVAFTAAYVQFAAGAFLRSAGRHGEHFGMTQLSVDF